ncbi:hypothetical protein GBF38_022279 [Nibea albiflora]|uniref:Uncharacterized protein n=1 Tax=Nibea albiflora TaxID=240163 RepID=A0ACB7FPE9_NIBAL|nr:hypothetical protein GBF38_022279 [Nibea albiflora]
MYSSRSEHGHNRQYSDRSSRHGYDDRREERRDPHRDVPRDSHYKHGGDDRSSAERTSRSREWSGSPKRLYTKDSLSRDRSRKSPLRRRMSSPDWGGSEKKRRRFTDGDEDDYRYRRVSEEKASRLSPDNFSRSHVTKDFKQTLPQEDDFKYRKTTQDSRQRYRHEEFTYRQQHDDSTSRRSSGYYNDRDGHEMSWDHSQERTRSQDCSTKSYPKPRERNDTNSTEQEDHHQNRARFPMNASSGQSWESYVTNQSAASPEQNRSAKGFQRFLDVLNKAVLGGDREATKIPTNGARAMNPRVRLLHSVIPGPSAQRGALCRMKSPCKGVMLERSYFSANSRPGSPSVMEKLTAEDEHKHRHMQDVLQAIGMNLGFEELGQMSHRIQERLYGKKDGDGEPHHTRSRERDTRRAFSPRAQSRSSSSRSSFSPSTREYCVKKEPYSSQRDETGVHQIQLHQPVEYGQNSSSSILQENEKSEPNSQESTAACQAFSQNPTYTLSEPSPTAVMPMSEPSPTAALPISEQSPTAVMPVYSPVNSSPMPYPTLPPNLPQVGPGLFLPRLPPFVPYPHVPPLNIFPAVLAQTRHLIPQHMSNAQPLLNLPIQPLNTAQKSKTLSRPRCLQVIETKQPG